MPDLSLRRLILKRMASDWRLLASIALGILVAATLVAGVPTYLRAVEKLGLTNAVDRQSGVFLDINVFTPFVPLERTQLERTDALVGARIRDSLSDLASGRERYVKAPLFQMALPGEELRRVAGEASSTGYLQFLSGLGEHVDLLQGRMPGDAVLQGERGPIIEAVVDAQPAGFFRLQIGDIITLAPSADAHTLISARISGIIEATDPAERYWQGNARIILTPPPVEEDEDEPPLALLVSESGLVEGIGKAYPGMLVDSTWFIYVNGEVIKGSGIGGTLQRLERFEKEIVDSMPRSGVFTGILPLLEQFKNRLFFSRVPLLLLLSLMLATVLFYLAMMVSYLVQSREEDVALLRSRGVGTLQLLRLFALEGLLLVGVAVIAAPFLAAGAVALLGKLPNFREFTGGQTLPVSLGAAPFLAALAGGFLCLLVLLVPSMLGARSGLVGHKLRSSRPPATPIFQRYYLDMGLLVVGGLIFWELRERGSLVSGGLFGSQTVNEALFFAPFLFLVAVTLILLRVFPLFIRLLSRVFSGTAPVWAALGLWHMARNPQQYSWLVLLLVLVTGLGVLATTLGGTLNRSYQERALYDAGTDLRVEGLPNFAALGTPRLKEAYLSIPGVTDVSLAYRGRGQTGTALQGFQFQLLAVDTRQFPYMAWYRDDFSRRPLTGIMRALQANRELQAIPLPDGAEKIGVWVKPGDRYGNIFLWVVLQDGRGRTHTVTLGSLGDPEWRFVEEEIPPAAVPPVGLVAMQIFEPVYGAAGTPGSLFLDDLQVTVDSQEAPQVVEGFEDLSNWTPITTSIISSDSISLSSDETHGGQASAYFTWGKNTERGVRGFYRSPSGGPLPVVASTTFLASTGKEIGDSMIVTVLGRFVPVVVRDTVDYFPTLNPGMGGFLLADLDLLLRHLNLLSPLDNVSANEIFVDAAPGATDTVQQVVESLVFSSSQIHDRESILSTTRLDPLITAGWRAMVFISIGVILLTASMGYLTYLLAFARRSRGEMGFLQAMGISRRQLMSLLGLEHILIVVMGTLLGTWAGLRMSSLSVSSVSHTETGDRVLPPFVLVTDWYMMALVYGILAMVVMGALLILNRSVVRLDLQTISRLEGG